MQNVACLGCQRALLHFLWGILANRPVCFLCSLVCACMDRDGLTRFLGLEWAWVGLSGLAVLRERVLECVCGWLCMCVCVSVCMSVCLRTCAPACVCVCVRAWVWLIKQWQHPLRWVFWMCSLIPFHKPNKLLHMFVSTTDSSAVLQEHAWFKVGPGWLMCRSESC